MKPQTEPMQTHTHTLTHTHTHTYVADRSSLSSSGNLHFFLSWVANAHFNYSTKWGVNTQLGTAAFFLPLLNQNACVLIRDNHLFILFMILELVLLIEANP